MNLEFLRNLDAIEPVLGRWRELAEGVAFRQPEWLLSWWENFRVEGTELFVCILRDEEQEVRVLAPWYLHRASRTLRCLGDGVVATDYCSILVDSRFSDRPLVDLFAAKLLLAGAGSDEWSALYLEAIDRHDEVMEAFCGAMRARGSHVHRKHCTNTWRVDVRDGWEPFLQGLSRNARKALRSRVRVLDTMEVRWVRSEDDLAKFFPVLVELHQKRRRALRDDGCFADPRFEEFLRVASGRLRERKQLQAFSIWSEGRPIAADIGFRARDRWLCYQSGLEPDALSLEPGKLANVCIIREAGNRGIHIIDFLRGDEPYKRQLRADPHPACDLILLKPGMTGELRNAALLLRAGARRARDGLRDVLTDLKVRSQAAWGALRGSRRTDPGGPSGTVAGDDQD
jgi:CelD/BcsL family acetyltransferase involved in cellulose biosynthesis